jgi:hypothetical protein
MVKKFIIVTAMGVYIELVLIKNFCVGYLLLYDARFILRGRCTNFKCLICAIIACGFGVLLPAINCNIFLKLAAGAVILLTICAMCVGLKKFKLYCKFLLVVSVAYIICNGTALMATRFVNFKSLFAQFVYLAVSVLTAILQVILSKKLAYRLRGKGAKKYVICTIYLGERHVELPSFYDSGNAVFAFGKPVSFISSVWAKKLGVETDENFAVDIATATGRGRAALFYAERVEVNMGERTIVLNDVLFAIPPKNIFGVVLHPDLAQ